MRCVPTGLSLVLAIVVAALPAGALAQAGPGTPGSTVGLPANPFASNYPSAPPDAEPGRGTAGLHPPRRRASGRMRPSRRDADAPAPPGAIRGGSAGRTAARPQP